MSIVKKVGKKLLPPPVDARHYEYSMLFSADDDKGKPSKRLMDIALESAKNAQQVDLNDIVQRTKPENYLDVWPGEHYKLLAGMVQTIKPKLVIEIGTAKGLSSLAMKKFLSADAKIVTFDIIHWEKYPGGNYLKKEDFADGRLIQYTDDLSSGEGIKKHAELLKNADFIFADAAKDGTQEQLFINNFKTIKFNTPPVIVFDDIRLWNMLKIWREISMPKLDITSFGHWSGTGIVEWKNI
jgi:predicted O-methyltransferase YrrM